MSHTNLVTNTYMTNSRVESGVLELQMAAGASAKPELRIKRCYRTPKSASHCVICGAKAPRMHMPIGHVGYFCARCCPACG